MHLCPRKTKEISKNKLVRDYSCPGKIMSTSTYASFFGFPDEKQSTGAYSKVSKRRKTTDGGVTPRDKCINKTKP